MSEIDAFLFHELKYIEREVLKTFPPLLGGMATAIPLVSPLVIYNQIPLYVEF